jgi:hypothetical protein
MRRLDAVLGTAGMAVILAIAPGTALAAAPKQVDTTITAVATAYDAHSGGAICWTLAGTATIKPLGRLEFSGDYCEVEIFSGPWAGTTYPYVNITFAAGNAGTFTIHTGAVRLDDPGSDPQVEAWTVTEATGRFTTTTGSGTYYVQGWDSPTTVLFALSGTFNRN